MYSIFMMRVSSKILSAILGGMAVFCLFYAAWLPDPDAVRLLLCKALVWGGAATAIVYCQDKYLS